MPKLLTNVPSYRKHKPSGRAVVTLGKRDVYLGLHGTAASRHEYDRVIAEWIANGRGTAPTSSGFTVVELVAEFLRYADSYYKRADGTPTGEAATFEHAVRPLLALYGRTPAAEFGPLKLKAVRQKMLDKKWCRTTINKHVSRVRAIFKWATENEYVPAAVHHGLQAVTGLKAGRSEARESEEVKPVADAVVEATLPFMSRQVRAMVEIQLLSGMRPGEIVMMRGADLDVSGKLWMYRPPRHKTQHHGHKREIPLGPKAQAILKPFLKPALEAYLFSPAEAVAEFNAAKRASRRTPVFASTTRRRRRSDPTNGAGPHYDVNAYRNAISSACDRAFPLTADLSEAMQLVKAWRKEFVKREHRMPRLKDMPDDLNKSIVDINSHRRVYRWHPNQLRHTAATRLRKEYGLEAAQVILGHQTLTVTQVYAEKNVARAQEIMLKAG